MRRLIILADVNGTRLNPPRVVRRSTHGSCDCRYAGRRMPPRARPPAIYGEGRKAPESPAGCKGGRKAPASPPEPLNMCRM